MPKGDTEPTPVYRRQCIGVLQPDRHSDVGLFEAAFAMIGKSIGEGPDDPGPVTFTFTGPTGQPVSVAVVRTLDALSLAALAPAP